MTNGELEKAARARLRLQRVLPEHRSVMIDQIIDTIDPQSVSTWLFMFADDEEVLDRIKNQFT